MCKRKKKEGLNDKIKQIEEANRRNETPEFYKDSTFFTNSSSDDTTV
jgi:hypothetical protein